MKILIADHGTHVALRTVEHLWDALAGLGWVRTPVSSPVNGQQLDRLIRKLTLGRWLPKRRGEGTFVVLMGPYRIPAYAWALLRAKQPKAALMFDVWEQDIEYVARIMASYGLDHVFLTAKQSAEMLAERAGPGRVTWFPEALPHMPPESPGLCERPVDVLQLGRKFDPYHEKIVDQGFSYVFEKVVGQVIYPTEEALNQGLASAKISVCFPRSVTHPEIAGCISTMTQRYLESMANRCLIVGECPPEMRELFGYDPVVQADLADPAGQLWDILGRIGEFQGLVDRNYEEVRSRHLLANRVVLLNSFSEK